MTDYMDVNRGEFSVLEDVNAVQSDRADLSLAGIAAAEAPAAAAPVNPVAPAAQAGGVAQEVMFHTNFGDIVIELYTDMPITTANFLNYVTHDRYDGSFFHRSVNNFVVQGGGFKYDGTNITTITAYDPITNEYTAAHPNAVQTIAMARTSDPNSATSQFFFNTVDNSSAIPGYAVFGKVIAGWNNVMTIAALPIYNFNSPFNELPLQNYPGGGAPVTIAEMVNLISADVLAIANPDSFSVGKAATVNGSLVANDQDLDTATITIAKVNGVAASVGHMITLPSGAHLTVNADGTYLYDPNHGFDSLVTGQSTADTFTYTLNNGSIVSGTTTATITVNGSGSGTAAILGTPGIDNLTGTAGNDVIDGLAGADSMRGLGGNDTYYVDQQGDLVYEFPNAGVDTVISRGNYYLYPYVENLTLAQGAGDIFGVGNDEANTMYGNEGNNTMLGGSNIDYIHGGAGNDILYGQADGDNLYGDDGNDFLAGGDYNDYLEGGAGSDNMYGEDGNDIIYAGSDFVFDQLVGGAGNDILHGDSGMADYDYLYGNAGDDQFYVDTGDDLTFEQPGEGTDTVYATVPGANNGVYLYANIENLVLLGTTAFGVGNELANNITGNAGANTLLGGAGNDTINGKGGNDILFGQAGADTFVFGLNEGADVIGDFTPGSDKIDVSAFAAFTSFASIQSHLVQNGTDTALDLGAGNLVVLQGVTKAQLTAGDFILRGASAAVTPVDHTADLSAVPHHADLHQLWHGSADVMLAL